MASKPFDKMIKSELEEAVAFLKLEDKVLEVAKDKAKITNAEYVKVLEAFKAEQDEANDEVAKEVSDAKTAGVKTVKTSKATPAEEKATLVEDLSTCIPVIVTDHDTSVIVEEEEEGRTIAIRWGNPVIGMSTTNVPLHGRMQYLPKACVRRLRSIPLASHVKDANGNEKSHIGRKRFSVADTTGWSEAEFESHKQEQLLKKI